MSKHYSKSVWKEKENRMIRIFTVIAQYLTAMGLLALAAIFPPVQAETFTVGRGSGIILGGILPFNAVDTLRPAKPTIEYQTGLAGIGKFSYNCMDNQFLENIGGYLAFPVGNGLGLIPRATVNATYHLSDGTLETMSGTLGLPETRGRTSSGIDIIQGSGKFDLVWCLPPRMGDTTSPIFAVNHDGTVTVAGDWFIVADGTQQSTIMKISDSAMFLTTNMGKDYRRHTLISSGNHFIRVSTLECSVDTPAEINFGTVPYSIQAGAELALESYSLSTQCTQEAIAPINANINVQLRSLSGLHEGNTRHLALNQGGGYITGEIDGVTGSGMCNGSGGVGFDSTAMQLATITEGQTSQTSSHKVIWRLCSGGSDLPTGPVTASAELLVTFN